MQSLVFLTFFFKSFIKEGLIVKARVLIFLHINTIQVPFLKFCEYEALQNK